MTKAHRVFISHAKEDAEFAHRLAQDLRESGLEVWIAPDSISPGEEWVSAINRGLTVSSHMLIVLTPSAVASKWVQTEVNAALDLAHKGKMEIIPLDVIPVELPTLWGTLQKLTEFGDDYAKGLKMLAGRLGRQIEPMVPSAAFDMTRLPEPMRPGLWACSRGHDNPADTRYCQHCGEELVRTCPECGQLKSLHSTGLCGNCGYRFDVAEKRKALSERISALNGEIASLRLQTDKAEAAEPLGCWAQLLGFGGGLVFFGGIWGFLTDPNQGRLPDALAQIALPLILAGIGMLVLVMIWRISGVIAKKRSIANLQAEAKLKEQDLVLFRQRHSELSLRRTGD